MLYSGFCICFWSYIIGVRYLIFFHLQWNCSKKVTVFTGLKICSGYINIFSKTSFSPKFFFPDKLTKKKFYLHRWQEYFFLVSSSIVVPSLTLACPLWSTRFAQLLLGINKHFLYVLTGLNLKSSLQHITSSDANTL